MFAYGKRGYIRTLEAIIAIVIILIFIFTVLPKDVPEVKTEYRIENYKSFLIKELQYNKTVREDVVAVDNVNGCERGCSACSEECIIAVNSIEGAIGGKIRGYDYHFKICDNPSCGFSYVDVDRSVYMLDVLIGSEGIINPLIVRVWIW